MKVRCIDNGDWSLTKGRVYDAKDVGKYYSVTNDKGQEDAWYDKSRFEVVSEAPDMLLPTDPTERKGIPIVTGVLDYFPRALAEVARLSKAGNEQHNPGQPLHWDKSKSTDHADTIGRHLIDRGKLDSDGQRHSAKVAWRALALLETELEAEEKKQ
jgi:hypothetical protein